MGMPGPGQESFGEEGPEGGFGARRQGGGRGSRDSVAQLVPGVMLLGRAPAKELVLVAKQAEVDVLCVFNVAVNPVRRTGQVINNTRIQLYNVADGKKAHETKKPLNNIQIQIARANENNRDADPVDEAMEKLFEYIDSNWKMAGVRNLSLATITWQKAKPVCRFCSSAACG